MEARLLDTRCFSLFPHINLPPAIVPSFSTLDAVMHHQLAMTYSRRHSFSTVFVHLHGRKLVEQREKKSYPAYAFQFPSRRMVHIAVGC